jgi:hypothetical protein
LADSLVGDVAEASKVQLDLSGRRMETVARLAGPMPYLNAVTEADGTPVVYIYVCNHVCSTRATNLAQWSFELVGQKECTRQTTRLGIAVLQRTSSFLDIYIYMYMYMYMCMFV